MIAMRVELVLILGIVFFCFWCAYIIVNMNASVSSSPDYSINNNQNIKINQQKSSSLEHFKNGNSSLAAAIGQLPAGHYVIREASEQPNVNLKSTLKSPANYSPSHLSLANEWLQPAVNNQPDYSSVSIVPSKNALQMPFNGVSAQSPQVNHLDPPSILVHQMYPANNNHVSLTPTTTLTSEEPDPDSENNQNLEELGLKSSSLNDPRDSTSDSVNNNADDLNNSQEAAEVEPQSTDDNLYGRLEEEQDGVKGDDYQEGEEADYEGQARPPRSEYEEHDGRRSYSEQQDDANERGPNGELISERRKHLINGRPVEEDSSGGIEKRNLRLLRRQRRPIAPIKADQLALATATMNHNYIDATKELKSKLNATYLTEVAPSNGSSLIATEKYLHANKPTGALIWPTNPLSRDRLVLKKQEEIRGFKNADTSNNFALNTTSNLKVTSPVNKRNNVSSLDFPSKQKATTKIQPHKLDKPLKAEPEKDLGQRDEQDLEEIDENSKDLEPKKKRNSHEHKLKESLQAQQWDDDSKSSPTNEEEDELVTHNDNVEAVVFEKEPGEEVEFKDLDSVVDSDKFPFMESRRKRSVDVSNSLQIGNATSVDDSFQSNKHNIQLNNTNNRPYELQLVKFDDDYNETTGSFPVLNKSSIRTDGSLAQLMLSSLNDNYKKQNFSLLYNNTSKPIENVTTSLLKVPLIAQEDLAIEVLANAPGQQTGNGSFLISTIPDVPLASKPQDVYRVPLTSNKISNNFNNEDYNTSGSKKKKKKVKYGKKSKLYEGKHKAAKAYKRKKKSKYKKGGMKKKKFEEKNKYLKDYKDFRGSSRGKKAKKGHGKKGAKKGKLYYMDKGYKKRGFKKNYQKFETGDHKTYFDEYRDKDHSKKWKNYDDKHHYSQSKKWSGNDKKKYKNYALKSAKAKKHGYGSWKEKGDSKFIKNYKHKKDSEKKSKNYSKNKIEKKKL